MGCKGSKLDVATGNTIKNRLLRRKSDASKGNNHTHIAQTEENKEKLVEKSDVKDVMDTENGTKRPSNVKDIGVNTEEGIGGSGDGEEGKGVVPGSPDEYFSPKKGEESVVAESVGYHSPGSELEVGGRREEGSSKVVEFKGVIVRMEGAEERHIVDEKGNEAKGEEDGKIVDKQSANLEEQNLVNKANPEFIVENKANHVGEITEEKGSEGTSTSDHSIIQQLKDGE